MAKRILLAGVLGGLAMFVWSALAHMVLGTGSVGVKDIPNEETMLAAMRTNLPQPGFYFFPGLGVPANAPRAEVNAAMERREQKAENGPSGIMIYFPSGRKSLTPGQLATEFATNIVQALLVALLLSFATGLSSYISRLGFVTLLGVIAGITTNISYWNWYGFPASYTAGYVFTEVMGYVSMGLVAAAIVKHGKPALLGAKVAA